MKKILIVFIGMMLISCCNQDKKGNLKKDVKSTILTDRSENFDWLLGKWKRLNEEEGKETFENWKKINDTAYSGIGFTLHNGDTVKQERMQLKKAGEKWNLIVKVPEESESVTFKGIGHNENEFTCENMEIDFPNRIKYWKNGKKLNASVSGGEMIISFEFEKLNKQN